jgi:hypothetical protein
MKKKALPLVLLLLFTLPKEGRAELNPAQQKTMTMALEAFQKGAYTEALSLAGRITAVQKDDRAALSLFKAASHAKLQEFDKAIPHYKDAIAQNTDAISVHYDLGQALFATQRLKEAEESFFRSMKRRYKIGASAYYIGYIRQLQEDYKVALGYYRRIQLMKQDRDKVKQPALYQMAEITQDKIAEQEEKNEKQKLLRWESEVVPLYERARDFEEGTATYDQSKTKIAELEREFQKLVEKMRNGVPIPRKPFLARFSQDVIYDTNVITLAEGSLDQVSYKDSVISRTGLFMRTQWNWAKRVSFLPELNLMGTMHSRRSTPRVFQNDNINFSPALRTKLEHTSAGAPATLQFDIEYNYMLRDYKQQHRFSTFTKSLGFGLSQRARWLSKRPLTLKVGVKFSENYNPDRNAITPSASISQGIAIGSKELQNNLSAEYLRARNDFNDEKTYRLRQSMAFRELFPKIDLNVSFTTALKDTMKQKGARGNELLLNPTLSLTRSIGNNLEGTLEYGYSKNISKDKRNYQYNKHEYRLGIATNL